jgi:hypothetical protein
MNNKRYETQARATVICVELALDNVETDIRNELASCEGDAGDALRRVLAKVRARRATVAELAATGTTR